MEDMCLKSFLSQTERKSDILEWLCAARHALIHPISAHPLECSFAPRLLGMLKRQRPSCGVTTHFSKLGQPPSISPSLLAACCHKNTAVKSCPKVQSMCHKPSLPAVEPSAQVLSGTQWCLWALQDCFHIKVNELVNFAVSSGCSLRIHGLSYFWFHSGFSPFPGETELNQQDTWCSWKEILIQGPDPESCVCLTPVCSALAHEHGRIKMPPPISEAKNAERGWTLHSLETSSVYLCTCYSEELRLQKQ